jgi:hypothetical protein
MLIQGGTPGRDGHRPFYPPASIRTPQTTSTRLHSATDVSLPSFRCTRCRWRSDPITLLVLPVTASGEGSDPIQSVVSLSDAFVGSVLSEKERSRAGGKPRSVPSSTAPTRLFAGAWCEGGGSDWSEIRMVASLVIDANNDTFIAPSRSSVASGRSDKETAVLNLSPHTMVCDGVLAQAYQLRDGTERIA